MKKPPALGLIILAACALCGCGPSGPAGDKATSPDTIEVGGKDPVIEAAIDQARASLPGFWALYQGKDPSRTDFAVNARLPAGPDQFELIWVLVDQRKDGKITGMLANKPEAMPDKKLGDTVSFNEGDIVDWSYTKNELIYGSFATRAMLPRFSAQEQATIRSQLSPTPTEPGQP